MSDDIRQKYLQAAFQNCVPVSITIELTLKCNLRCVHCYNFDRDKPLPEKNRTEELETREIIDLMDEARELGTLFLTLTGGEAMAHPDFWTLLTEAKHRRLSVTLLSNATLIGPEEADRLADIGIQKFSTSLYGATPETHDHLTQKPGSFEKTIRGIKLVADRGVPVRGKFILMNKNRHEVDQMKNLADELPMDHAFNASITRRQDEIRDRGPLSERIPSDKLEDLYRNELREDVLQYTNPDEDGTSLCNCARAKCAITATGDVQPCIAVPEVAGNVREESLAEIWANANLFQKIRNLSEEDFPHCKPCPIKSYCRRNNGNAVMASGDYTGVDRWQCREAEIIRSVYRDKNQAADQ